ncbi:tetraspanin-6 [Microcaecilia unicolor]|uniref:Tetraspanin n=1 Tax=Microcaecilia unicolor TaxID=1415580 RepID=A0A6P7YKW8_9AMPH|nr:tetraspanin-6 [Microcaecilia unicolor]
MASPSRRLQTKPVITCLKSVLLIFSFIFWFTGVILLVVGVWGKVSLEVYFSLLNEQGTKVPFVLIGTGTVIVLLGTFGCFATCRGSTWMLKLYAMFLTIIFLVELVAAIVGFVFRHELKSSFKNSYKKAQNDYKHPQDASSRAVDTIQKNLHCCGVFNFTDWASSAYFEKNGLPQSCCNLTSGSCTEDELKNMTVAQGKVFNKGCFASVTLVMESNMSVVAGISFGIACFQLIGIFLACCLSHYITNNQYEMV